MDYEAILEITYRKSRTVTMKGQARSPYIFRRLLLGGQRVANPSRTVLRAEKLGDPIAVDHRASDRVDRLIQADGNIFILRIDTVEL